MFKSKYAELNELLYRKNKWLLNKSIKQLLKNMLNYNTAGSLWANIRYIIPHIEYCRNAFKNRDIMVFCICIAQP